MEDPWILPTPNTLSEPIVTDMPLPATMIAYQANIGSIAEPSPSSSRMEEEDPYALPTWVVLSSHSHDYFDDIFPMDEATLEAMSGVEPPWGELHHRSYFLHKLDRIECDENRTILSEKVGSLMVPLSSLSQIAEGNMDKLSPTIS